MRLEDQVVSFELAKKLKDLGVEQSSVFDYQRSWHDKPYKLNPGGSWETADKDGRISAFTVAELGEMLPNHIIGDEVMKFDLNLWREKDGWLVAYWWDEDSRKSSGMAIIPNAIGSTEADARAKMLIYLVENELLPTNNPQEELNESR